MHSSSVEVVRIEIVDALIAHSCLLLVVNITLGMSFHDLSDIPAQVLQQSHEVIDLILLHQSNALALIEFIHAIHEDLIQLLLRESLVGADASDIPSPLLTEEP